MKSKFIVLVSLFCYYTSPAQLTITPGAQLSIFSDTKLTLQNTDLINNGDFLVETTGHLDGERDDSRIIGANGGNVVFSVNLNSPTNSNPANLGVFITTGQDLGNVIIKRGHQSQANNGAGPTILRYYDIFPANNT